MTDLINYRNNEKKLLTEISNNSKPTLVEVRAEWSGGSHLMDLIVNKIGEEFRKEVRIVRIDFEVHKELLNQFGVISAPALLLISKGQLIEVIKETLSRRRLEKIVRDLVTRNSSTNQENKPGR